MAYEARDWTPNETVTATKLNTVRDSLNYVFNERALSAVLIDAGSNYTMTSTSWADIDATNLKVTITVRNGRARIVFNAPLVESSGSGNDVDVYFDFTVDGTRAGGDDGLAKKPFGVSIPIFIEWIAEGLSDGSHEFGVQWKTTGGGTRLATLYAGAGTSNKDLHPVFIAEEKG